MKIDHHTWVFSKKSVPREPLGVNAIILRQFAREIQESMAQPATRSEIVPWELSNILKGTSQHLNVFLRSDQFLKDVLFWGWCSIDLTARTHCDLVYEG